MARRAAEEHDMTKQTLMEEASHPASPAYALRRERDFWEVTYEGRRARFPHELGAQYVACLLLEPPREPIHAVVLALKARARFGPGGGGVLRGTPPVDLNEAATVQALWRRQRELERVLADRWTIEPVKAEALRELEEVTEFLRRSSWPCRHGAARRARAVAVAIKRLHAHLAGASEADRRSHAVLTAFSRHLYHHLLVPSGRGGRHVRGWPTTPCPPGCFTYAPPAGIVWQGGGAGPDAEGRGLRLKVSRWPLRGRWWPGRTAAADYLARFLSLASATALVACGCAAPRPFKGGRAVVTRKPAGVVEQTLQQGENAAQATRQNEESVKVRSYTVPAGSRLEPPPAPPGTAAGPEGGAAPATAFVLSAPMAVVEREESRARTELGAAQKDTARELGARLASLKGIVWGGVGLFGFGLASLVWPPLRVAIGSVTTSAAMLLGGLALMVLPAMVVGNELLVLGGVALAVGGWFLAHWHGRLRGLVTANGAANGTAEPPPAGGAPR